VVEYLGYSTTSAFSFLVVLSATAQVFEHNHHRQETNLATWTTVRPQEENGMINWQDARRDEGGQMAVKAKDMAANLFAATACWSGCRKRSRKVPRLRLPRKASHTPRKKWAHEIDSDPFEY
jgi:hypothetical protein